MKSRTFVLGSYIVNGGLALDVETMDNLAKQWLEERGYDVRDKMQEVSNVRANL